MKSTWIATNLLLFPALATISGPGQAQGSVWVVDNSSGGITTIQDAIDLSAAGDLVLVRGGSGQSYAGFQIDGKGISVVGDGPIDVLGSITVSNVSAAQHVTLRNFEITYAAGQGGLPLALHLDSNSGPIWLEELSSSGSATAYLNPLLTFEACASVLLNHCNMDPGSVKDGLGLFPSHGLVANDSLFVLMDSVIDGIPGRNSLGLFNTGIGGDAIFMTNSHALAAGIQVKGGDGGDGAYLGIGCAEARDGGNGVTVDPSSIFDHLGSTFLPGVGGAPCNAFHAPGEDGVPIFGSATDLQNSFRNLTISSPTRAGGSSSVQVDALAGELAFLLFGSQPQFTPLLQFDGYLLLPLVPGIQSLGQVDAAGALTQLIAWPLFPASLDMLEFYAQLVVVDSSGSVVLGGASSLHVVNQAF